jgi:chemotaxis protein MotB
MAPSIPDGRAQPDAEKLVDSPRSDTMKRMLPIILAASLPLGGCVMQGTYDALQKTLDETRSTLQQRDTEKAEVQATLEKEQAHSRELGTQIEKLSGDLKTMTDARDALQRDNAAIVSDKSKLQASVEEMKRALAELTRRKAEADARIAEFKGLLERFKALIDAGKLKVKIVDGRMVVELASDVLFASGSATLSKDGQTAIREVAGILATIPDRKFQVEGHTDNVPIRSSAYPSNWELASSRALTVVKQMVDAGMPGERISASSYGEFKPAKPNDSPEGKAANRRIEIVVVPDLSSLPGFEELKRASAQ